MNLVIDGRVTMARLAAVGIVGLSAALTTVAGAADMGVVRKAPDQPSQASGYVELYGGWAEAKNDFTSCTTTCVSGSGRNDAWALGGAGRANYWWAPNASVQLDAQGEGTNYRNSGAPGSFSVLHYLVGGHASWRDPQRGLLGIFGGAGDAAYFRHGLIGLEGQAYWGILTLYGQVGYDSTFGALGTGQDGIHAWFVRGTARLYVNPNFRLEGTVFYADVAYDLTTAGTSAESDTWLWRGRAEYKFATSPFAIFTAYEGSRTTVDSVTPTSNADRRWTDHRIVGGIRLYLGENTLQWNDRQGATLDIITPFGVPSYFKSSD
jgi:hypothetical protein